MSPMVPVALAVFVTLVPEWDAVLQASAKAPVEHKPKARIIPALAISANLLRILTLR